MKVRISVCFSLGAAVRWGKKEGQDRALGGGSSRVLFSWFMPHPMQARPLSPPGFMNGEPVLWFRYFWDLCYISTWGIKMSQSRGA